jgi:hypothetical protein
MAKISNDLKEIVNMSMPFPLTVIKSYSQLDLVFTSGDLSRNAKIPRSTAKFYIRKMVKLHMISKVPYRKKYQKYTNAKCFSDWLQDLIRLAIKNVEDN